MGGGVEEEGGNLMDVDVQNAEEPIAMDRTSNDVFLSKLFPLTQMKT